MDLRARVLGGRYRVEELLGEGSFGVVHRARDLLHDRDVALKTARDLDAARVYGLKREFRALAALSHRNLVQLYELCVSEDECFFTMELVRGVDVVSWVQSAPVPERDARLRRSVLELVQALELLHAHGTLHRDVKPTNVLVERDGRVVLLDFGLAMRFGRWRTSRMGADGDVAGSAAYMAPELLWGGETSVASDWYSVGVVLFEALSGRVPFTGDDVFDLVKRQQRPPPVRRWAPDVPDGLAALVQALLDPDAARRPGAAEIRAMLAAREAADAPVDARLPAGTDHGPFVGRAPELAAIADALAALRAGRPTTVLVHGESGIGKTALVTRALAALENDGDAIVLRGRCHPRESVPFSAVDAVMEEVAAILFTWPGRVDELVPPDLDCLVQVFPVLGRVPSLREHVTPSGALRDPAEIRRRAVGALGRLLANLGARRPVVMWIDDLQWGDRDGALVLRELRLSSTRGRVGFVLSFRSEDRASVAGLGLLPASDPASPDAVVDLSLAPLPAAESRALVEEILRTRAVDDASAVDEIVSVAGGSPLFVSELARQRTRGGAAAPLGEAPSSHALLAQRTAALPPATRRVLELVAVSGQPLSESVFQRAARGCDVPHAIVALANDSLVRYVPGAIQPEITTYHDRIRETVLGHLAEPDRRALHVGLAEALEGEVERDPELLFHHWLGGGRADEAARYAIIGAERAATALAFNRAAELYRRALDLGGGGLPVWDLHARLGDALVNAGFGALGAAELTAAADALPDTGGDGLDVLRLRRRAAEHFLRSGRHPEGLAVLKRVLAALDVGYARTTGGALVSLIGNRMRLALRRRRTAPASGRLSARDHERLEACWSAGVGLGLFDTLRAADFQVRHALLAHASGVVGHEARALLIEAFLLSWEGGEAKRARSLRLRDDGERLAIASGDPNVQAFGLVLRGVTDLYLRRFHSSLATCTEGETLCRDRCVGAAWEMSNFRTLRGIDLAYMGELGRLADHMRDALRQAEATGDHYYLVNARLGMTNLAWLGADRPDEARRQASLALAGPFPSSFSWQVYQGELANAHIDLYTGDAPSAHARATRAWRQLRAQQLLRFQTPRLEMAELRARSALALSAHPDCPPTRRERLLRRAARDARRLVAEEVAWPRPFADAIGAAIAGRRGDDQAAVAGLERAARGWDDVGMALHAACARWHVASAGGASATRATLGEWMRERGARNAAAMAGMLVASPWTS